MATPTNKYNSLEYLYRDLQRTARTTLNGLNTFTQQVSNLNISDSVNNASQAAAEAIRSTTQPYLEALKQHDQNRRMIEANSTVPTDTNPFLDTIDAENQWETVVDGTPPLDLIQKIQTRKETISVKLGQYIYAELAEEQPITVDLLHAKLPALLSKLYSFQI